MICATFFFFIFSASDNHLKSPEDITLTDQIPVERDAYVAITFDDVSPFCFL